MIRLSCPSRWTMQVKPFAYCRASRVEHMVRVLISRLHVGQTCNHFQVWMLAFFMQARVSSYSCSLGSIRVLINTYMYIYIHMNAHVCLYKHICRCIYIYIYVSAYEKSHDHSIIWHVLRSMLRGHVLWSQDIAYGRMLIWHLLWSCDHRAGSAIAGHDLWS